MIISEEEVMADTPTSEHYWFNTQTGQVEKGPQSSWENRMGPYDTEAQARSALDTAASKSAQWEREDAKWEDG